ncbi:putative flap endonuclease-1-like 5' DNA nuclease [Arthrobacter pigmenti]|uniref:Putative flap endonuclease-1-like 5' DNA nuclease n=1 Tax=Arthrobacter pigmenti TaxID=271432 RepID=A0A846RK36_9MICC|nr:hypothetical protein [Arthrobacter pigmenti]NJC23678.1 putative flap endonuclease-1-like 5' DNA nuclease [Arthrobacter pigmenti]
MPEDSPVPTEYPREIGRTARRELARHGYTTFAQLEQVTAKDLLAVHGVGPNAVRILEAELAAMGTGFLKPV